MPVLKPAVGMHYQHPRSVARDRGPERVSEDPAKAGSEPSGEGKGNGG